MQRGSTHTELRPVDWMQLHRSTSCLSEIISNNFPSGLFATKESSKRRQSMSSDILTMVSVHAPLADPGKTRQYPWALGGPTITT